LNAGAEGRQSKKDMKEESKKEIKKRGRTERNIKC
jgi:hypothetical protein